MSVHTVTTVTNNNGDMPILHLGVYKDGRWKAECGTRIRVDEVSRWAPQYVSCERCWKRLRKEGLV